MDLRRFALGVVLIFAARECGAADFFANISLGGSNYQPQSYATRSPGDQWHSHSEALRFGYRWGSDALSYGLETGYANMGPVFRHYGHIEGYENRSERIDGYLFGMVLKYSLFKNLYVSARGGFFWSTGHARLNGASLLARIGSPVEYVPYSAAENKSGLGSYIGLGAGYDFTRSFGIGIAYDRYRAHVHVNSDYTSDSARFFPDNTSRVDSYTVTAEYRF